MKNILIPTDFSDNAKDALEYALQFIESDQATIHIANVVIPPLINDINSAAIDTSVYNMLKEDANYKMNALKTLSKIHFEKKKITNVNIETHVLMGDVISNIKSVAKEISADLIIMGTLGENHNKFEKAIGTISTTITNKAPCPILLIPYGYKYRKIDNVIFSTDLYEGDPYVLYKSLKLLHPHNPSVRCCYVTNNAEDISDKSIKEFGNYIIEQSSSIQTFFEILIENNTVETISQQAIKYNAELIIMHKSKKTLLKSIFGTKHVKGMINILSNPLLVMN